MTYDTAKRIFNGYEFDDVVRVTLRRRERYMIYTNNNGLVVDIFEPYGNPSAAEIKIVAGRWNGALSIRTPLAQVSRIYVNNEEGYVGIKMKNTDADIRFRTKLKPKGENA